MWFVITEEGDLKNAGIIVNHLLFSHQKFALGTLVSKQLLREMGRNGVPIEIYSST